MCGIGGCAVRPEAEPDVSALDRIASALRHRGPDDSGVTVERNVGLVNARLAIVDTSPAGHQPMGDRSGRWTLTYNGEIFNHLELRRQLSPIAFRGTSDTETLLHGLDRWGPAGTATRSSGFFAFAALDAAERKLFLVRDRFGVKPLYVVKRDDAVWFASEIGSLLAAGIPARPLLAVLSDTVRVGLPHDRETALEGIERVRPGSVVAIDLDTLETTERRWWEPADDVDPEHSMRLAAAERAELCDRVETALREGVSRRLMADVPVGTMCSGGIDSSLVTAFARDERPSVTAFNASMPDEGRADERRWAEIAARSLGVELETVTITSRQWRQSLVEAVRHHEYPFVTAGSVQINLMAQAARSRGVKVLLTGEAADELFAGYVEYRLSEYRDFLPRSMMLRRLVEVARTHGPRWTLQAMGRSLVRRVGGERPAPESRSTASALRYREAVTTNALRAYQHHPGPRGRLEASLLAYLSKGGFPYLLIRMDKDAMARSIETRLPFLDREVVSLALNLPLEARTRPDPKGVLRDVARRHLPAAIVKRAKQGGLRVGARRIETAARSEFVQQGVLRDLLRAPAPSWDAQLKQGSERDRVRLWTAEIWCRLFVEGESVQRIETELWDPSRM